MNTNKNLTPDLKPFGIQIAQNWTQVGALFECIQHYEIELVVELGTWLGGLTALLASRSVYDPSFAVVSYEVNPRIVDPRVLQHCDVRIADIFDIATVNQIHDRIAIAGRTLLVCDNGNKPREVYCYWDRLKHGDFLTAHDFGAEIHDMDFDCLRGAYDEVDPIYYRDECNMPIWRRR